MKAVDAAPPDPSQPPLDPDAAALRREVLLRDLEYWGECFWRNEESGERRVNFYITLVTSVMAALTGVWQLAKGSKATADADAVLRNVATPALLGLLIVGTITFLRMIRRNTITDEYKERAKAVRMLALGPRDFENLYNIPWKRRGSGVKVLDVLWTDGARSLFNGGLAVTVAALNSLVAGVLAGVRDPARALGTGAWAAAGVFLAQVIVSLAVELYQGARSRRRQEDRARRLGWPGQT